MAAAISDFYIPFSKMVKDKIQSKGGHSGGLTLNLDNTPKCLKYFKYCLESQLSNDLSSLIKCYLISFKLETLEDTTFLFDKARKAIEKYGSTVVVSNFLQTRKKEIWMVTKDDAQHIELKNTGHEEIEQSIIEYLLQMVQK